MRFVLPAVVIASLAAMLPAQADGSDVAYSSTTTGKGCRTVLQPPPGNHDEHHPVIEQCGGTAGFRVRIEYLGASVHVRIGKGDVASAPVTLGAPYGVGPAIEWRGVRAANGFRPHAAILRLLALNDKQKPVSVLGVLVVDGDRICAAAFVDPALTPNANEEARITADRLAGSFRCGTDPVTAVGRKTELIEEVASRGGIVVQ